MTTTLSTTPVQDLTDEELLREYGHAVRACPGSQRRTDLAAERMARARAATVTG